MNNIYKIIAGCAVMIVVSCTKYRALEYSVDMPETVALQEDIDSYPALKTYINRTKHPNFKLGTALGLSDYVNKGVMFRLANRNFDEFALGWEMKHMAVVQADGSLSLDNVSKLLSVASAAGVSVYGHTLCWHANQNAKYLNSLIEPVIIPGQTTPTWDLVAGADFETDDASAYEANANAKLSFTASGQGAGGKGRALKITNDAVRTNEWDAQFFIKFSPAVKVGEQYTLSMDVRSDAAASFSTQAHTVPYTYKYWDFFGSISSGTSWTTYTKQITVTADMAGSGAIAFNLGKTATNYYFDNVTLKKYNEKGGGDAGYAFTFTNPTASNFWDAQVAYDLPALDNNKEYTLRFAAKANKAGTIRAELQSSADYSSNSFGTVSLTQAWQEFELKTTTTKNDRNRFVISFGDFAGKVSIDNVTLTPAGSVVSVIPNGGFENGANGWAGWGNNSSRGLSALGEGYGGAKDQIIEKTAAEKDAIITAALEHWIAGMLGVSKNYVKAWDVVNEPMDDGKPYELKTGIGRTKIAEDEFFWQDYMGKDYAVKALQLARKYGNTTDLHFINDYNLEYNLDKCKGIIAYVNYLEGKGAKVNGIGTQMHIDINTSKTNITEMFKLLAATGKLVKISELDIGLGGVKTADATQAQYQAQAEMYKYVIDEYFKNVPAAQRYGITLWSPLDSPASSSWRAGEPIGIWTEGYVRKLAYSYVARALEENAK
ncbi:endo-1,4-beta-xylanase [Filimonas effusa]|uniref:Beta-xylanase n=1 Tax=Filimonas effusa TaxID=2508721 RepID=A0A4Q1D0B8_9BACT|nr:endo-1,4-beta-xylanase [Filimonas effusa]RXK81184.1 1,4-beta-xylanase [Filimonas effusa]